MDLKDSFIEKASQMILGKNYSVSFAFIGDEKMKELNNAYRKINKTTDILSFPLEKNEGEILISKKETAKKAKTFFMKPQDYLNYLLIHGLLHLKGMAHGSKMESKEREFCEKFNFAIPNFLLLHEQKNNSRNRHRNSRSAGDNSGTRIRKRIS